MSTVNPQGVMRKWLDLASTDQKRAVALAADTSIKHMEHIAAGRRQVHAELASRLAQATLTLGMRYLELDQRTLCQACEGCGIVDKRKAAPKHPRAKPTK